MTIAILEFRDHPDTRHAAHDAIACLDVAQLSASGVTVLDRDDRVHPLVRHFDPVSPVSNQRAMVGGRVEIIRHTAIAVGGLDERVLLIGQTAPERHQLFEDLSQHVRGGRGDPHRNERRIVVAATDVELEDFEGRVALDHGIEHSIENL